MKSKRILIIATNECDNQKNNNSGGLWFSTISRFVREIEKENYQYLIISPKGGRIPIQKLSLKFPFMNKTDWKTYGNADFMYQLINSFSPEKINPQNFDAVYLAGGAGVLWDFQEDAALQNLVRQIYENGGVVATMGRSIAALLNIKLADGSYMLDNKQVTAASNFEEKLTGQYSKLLFSVEEEVKTRGAIYRKARFPFGKFVVTDGQLVTGQTPCATAEVAQEIMRLLYNVHDSLKETKFITTNNINPFKAAACL
jgi:putative intracellular protease/amidase